LSAHQQKQLVSATLDGAREKDALLRSGRIPIQIEGKIVVLVDDGIATGYTTRAAIGYIRRRKPAKLILAVPVAPPDSLQTLRRSVDDIICLETPELFGAVGAFYEEFPQVEDAEVRELLEALQR
jgi:putative phosphoribosyl transferase